MKPKLHHIIQTKNMLPKSKMWKSKTHVKHTKCLFTHLGGSVGGEVYTIFWTSPDSSPWISRKKKGLGFLSHCIIHRVNAWICSLFPSNIIPIALPYGGFHSHGSTLSHHPFRTMGLFINHPAIGVAPWSASPASSSGRPVPGWPAGHPR